MEYWVRSCSIWLKNNTVHGINKPWTEKTSTEDLKNSEQIAADDYERLDQLHYKVENALLKLIESLQKKQTDNKWEDNFHSK